MNQVDFEAVLRQGAELQRLFPGKQLVAVGGTAAAVHCHHRFSMDVDCVTPCLREEFGQFQERLEDWHGWHTNRKNPPVLILGERAGVELGIRQLRRTVPLRTAEGGGLLIPTLAEMIRVKAFLLAQRRATRDYIDFAALTVQAGLEDALRSLVYLNLLYPAKQTQTIASSLAEAAEGSPIDLGAIELREYKGAISPFNDWTVVSERCREVARELLKLELTGGLPHSLPADFE